jgi:two-component system phosphate regulon sensor histidine kinase PhoR
MPDRSPVDDLPREHTAPPDAEVELSHLRMILDTLPAGVMELTPPDGRVERANEAALQMIFGAGEARERLPRIYKDFRWLQADGTELPRSRHPGIVALRGEAVGRRALILQNAEGTHIPVRVQSTPVRNGNGSIVGSVVLIVDVSREQAAEQVKDDFLSLISHEFRTPLTAIHGGALLLSQQGDAMDTETRRELLQDIGAESARLDRMLGNLLSVSAIMAGRFQASTEPILIAPLMQRLVDEFSQRAVGHEFTIVAEGGMAPAEGAPELLVQILQNLYENAVKYSPGGGEIRTVLREQDGKISIAVIDHGLGISAEHVPHVFERFRRPGAEPTVRGMGLGLYLSRLLVDAQGGTIRAMSPGPGKGATFMLELPMVRDWVRDQEVDDQMEQTS